MAGLADGTVRGVVNVDVLIEGFDCPAVKCIVLARPTKSLTRYLQQVGRGSRRLGSTRPIVIDHAGNTWRFGLPEAERTWSLADAPHVKGHVLRDEDGIMVASERSESELEEAEAELRRLEAQAADKAAARKRIEAVARTSNAPRGWVDQVLAEMFP